MVRQPALPSVAGCVPAHGPGRRRGAGLLRPQRLPDQPIGPRHPHGGGFAGLRHPARVPDLARLRCRRVALCGNGHLRGDGAPHALLLCRPLHVPRPVVAGIRQSGGLEPLSRAPVLRPDAAHRRGGGTQAPGALRAPGNHCLRSGRSPGAQFRHLALLHDRRAGVGTDLAAAGPVGHGDLRQRPDRRYLLHADAAENGRRNIAGRTDGAARRRRGPALRPWLFPRPRRDAPPAGGRPVPRGLSAPPVRHGVLQPLRHASVLSAGELSGLACAHPESRVLRPVRTDALLVSAGGVPAGHAVLGDRLLRRRRAAGHRAGQTAGAARACLALGLGGNRQSGDNPA